jgi:thiol-disulfide isomerase/thioredoxin/Flp pilus assembly protein TadD
MAQPSVGSGSLPMRLVTNALCLATLLCSLFQPCFAQPAQDYRKNPKFRTAISDGKLLARNQEYELAIASYEEASKIARGKDKGCLRALIDLEITSGNYADAIDTAHAFRAIATTAAEKSYAETTRGRVLFLQAEPQSGSQYDSKLLTEADTAFKAALSLDPKNPSALLGDGEVLVHLGQIEAARTQFKACLTYIKPDDPSYGRTQRFAENPALALQQMAPAFTVTALDGSRFNLDKMNGRVVLIDFWATWCVPCLKELPHLKEIAKDFAGQPLVILSISWDEDQQTWKDFIAKNGMPWPQYRDADHRLGQLFEIEGLPSYFTIDSDGVLTAEMLGEGSDVEGKLKKLVARAKATQPLPTHTETGN